MEDATVRRGTSLLEARIDGELVGLHVDRGACFGFNATATRIWELIEQPKRLFELRDILIEEYEVDPETCESHLRALLDELERDGLVSLDLVPAA